MAKQNKERKKKVYVIKGTAKFRKVLLPFEKEVEGFSQKHAIHNLYSLFSSHNGLRRSLINITSVKELG